MPDKKISELTTITNTNLDTADVFPVVDMSVPETKKITLSELDKRYHSIVCLQYSLDQNTKNNQDNIHGGLIDLSTAQSLSVGNDIVITNGVSKIMLSVNAGTDLVGNITLTGITVDRNTGVETGSDTEVISINGLTTDTSSVDGAGQVIHAFVGGYMTSKWFKGSVTISTTNTNLSDVDVYQLNFEQFNDHEFVTVETFDMTFNVANTAAYFAGHLYKVISNGTNLVDISVIADLELPVGESEVGSYRLRKGELNILINGITDGVFVDLFFKPDSQQYFTSITNKVWVNIYNS